MKVPTQMIPLRGGENAFLYKTDSCEYILETAVGKEKRKSAR